MNEFIQITNFASAFIPIIVIFAVIYFVKKSTKNGNLIKTLSDLSKIASENNNEKFRILSENTGRGADRNMMLASRSSTSSMTTINLDNVVSNITSTDQTIPTSLNRKSKYLHIALNNTMEEAYDILSKIPRSDRILIEVGTPLIKIYGTDAIRQIKAFLPSGTYIVADNKCTDLAQREVSMMAEAGANAATCLGVAPIETIDEFISQCEKNRIDSMIDMMNVDNALSILKKLKKLPTVVMLHRGVDESEFSKEKQIPYYQIKQIKGNYNIMVAVAGGDTIKEVQRAIFNDADIVVVWKNFYSASADTATLADSFLKEI